MRYTPVPSYSVGHGSSVDSALSAATRNGGRWAPYRDDHGRPATLVYLNGQRNLMSADIAELQRLARDVLRSEFPGLRGGRLPLVWQVTVRERTPEARGGLIFTAWTNRDDRA